MNCKPFFGYACERYRILLRRRRGQLRPWTADPILQQFSFCNVFREDDRTTVWFRDRLRGPLSESPHVFIAVVAFRWFNRITTGEAMADVLLTKGWNRSAVLNRVQAAPKPLFTGAYMVRSDVGRSKMLSIIDAIDSVAIRAPEFVGAGFQQLEAAYNWLLPFKLVGRFVAYEIITDLRHTHLLRDAKDINSWASAGPGAARGLAWLEHGGLDKVLQYGSTTAQERMCTQMRELLEASRLDTNWPKHWPAWEMREVEHSLCEYDKFRRAGIGGHLKKRYAPAR